MNRIIMPTLTVLALGAVVLTGCSTSTPNRRAMTSTSGTHTKTRAGEVASATFSLRNTSAPSRRMPMNRWVVPPP